MEKSRDDEGEEGVTIMAGNGDFSVASERERSNIKNKTRSNSLRGFQMGSYRGEQGLRYSRFDGANDEKLFDLVIQKLWSCEHKRTHLKAY